MIAAMKRIFSLLILTILILAPAPSLSLSANAATASEQYAVVPDGDVWFYAGETESSRVFLLPRTYYVKVLSTGETYSRVEYLVDEPPYKKVTGYCKTADIIPVDYIPARPYLKKQVTLSYSLPTAGGAGSIGDGSFSSVEKTFVYYGQLYDGAKLYYYVLSDGTFDYIPANSELVFDQNTDYLEYLAAQETAGQGTDTPPSSTTNGMDATLIVVICIACVAAVAVAVFIIKGKKTVQDDQSEE